MSQNGKSLTTLSDAEVARIVVSRDLATRDEVDACIDLEEKLAEKHTPKSLLELLVEQKVVSVNQAKRLLKDAENSVQLRQIPGYQLLARLGQGSMGVVYKAKQLSMDRVVAIKVLQKALAANKEFITRFQREARMAAKLNNSHVVQAIDVGEANGQHYFIMEYVEGPTVKDYLDKSKVFDENEALTLVLHVADALEHAHERGLVHRDVKPENIIMATGGVTKLADLGLARQTEDEKASMAEAGVVIGTPYYISPEQIRGETEIDGRTDIYSLGATLYHMVTGQVPFDGETPTVVMQRHLRDGLVPPDHLNTNLSDGLGEVVETMMAKRREDRYANVADMIIDLEHLRRGEAPLLARTKYEAQTLAGLAEADDLAEPLPDGEPSSGRLPAVPAKPSVGLWSALVLSLLANLVLLLLVFLRQ